MADISAEITAFKNAVYGEDVRDAMVSLANKLNTVIVSSETQVFNAVSNVQNNANDICISFYDLYARSPNIKKCLNTDGTLSSHSNYFVSDFVPVKTGDKVYASITCSTSLAWLCSYSSNDQSSFIQSYLGEGESTRNWLVYTVPDGVTYIRISCMHLNNMFSYIRNTTNPNWTGIWGYIVKDTSYDWQFEFNNQLNLDYSNDVSKLVPFIENKVLNINANNKLIFVNPGNNNYKVSYVPIPLVKDMYISYKSMYAINQLFFVIINNNLEVSYSVYTNTSNNYTVGSYTCDDDDRLLYIFEHNDASYGSNVKNSYIRLFKNEAAYNIWLNEKSEYSKILSKSFYPLYNNLFDTLTWVKGFIQTNGVYYASTNGVSTDEYIPVYPGVKIHYKLASSVGFCIIAAYDYDGIFMECIDEGAGQGNPHENVYTVPLGVGFIRCCTYKTSGTSRLYLYIEGFEKSLVYNNTYEDYTRTLLLHHRKYITGSQGNLRIPTLTLAWFSDIHGSEVGLQYITRYIKNTNNNLIQDVICTGDLVTTSVLSGMTFWDNNTDAANYLFVLGNHDVWADNTLTSNISISDQYETYFKNRISNWGSTFNMSEDTVWWYKDYTTQKIRLIGLACRDHNQDEQTWLSSVLNDALTNDLAVIVANHFQPENGEFIDSNFTRIYNRSIDSSVLPTSIMSIIQNFINNGGEFICHIAGHTHCDYVMKSHDYPNQLALICTDASDNSDQNLYGDQDRSINTENLIAFNLFTIDRNRKIIKLIRVGAHDDMTGRSRKTICINYQTQHIDGES